MSSRQERARFSTLFLALVLFLVLGPFVNEGPSGIARERLLFTAVMLGGLYAASTTRGAFLIGLGLALPALGAEWIPVWNDFVVGTVHLFAGLLLIYVPARVLAEIFQQDRVTPDTVLGGASVYLLLGIFFVVVYSALEWIEPGSFTIGGVALTDLRRAEGLTAYPGLIYYSFVTLTTLGYGDMIPASDRAQHMAVIEAIAGQLFVATFIARLVALQVAHSRPKT